MVTAFKEGAVMASYLVGFVVTLFFGIGFIGLVIGPFLGSPEEK